jgi:hypothetical protein
MGPTNYELEIAETVKNLIYARKELGMEINKELKAAASTIYFTKEEGDKWVAELCGILSGLSKAKENKLVYNAKSADSRKLADWWEEHQAADKKRIADEKKKTKEDQERKTALSKLTPKERKLLGL